MKHSFEYYYKNTIIHLSSNRQCKIGCFNNTTNKINFTIQIDRLIGARRPDITILDKERRKCQLIDIACPGDNRVAEKEGEKIDK